MDVVPSSSCSWTHLYHPPAVLARAAAIPCATLLVRESSSGAIVRLVELEAGTPKGNVRRVTASSARRPLRLRN